MAAYQFRTGRSFGVSAQVAGEHFEQLRESNNGVLDPRQVVDVNRPEEAPLHPCFEWDDDKAAEAYRVDQARQIIRSVRVVTRNGPTDMPKRERVYVSVGSPHGGPGYVTAVRAMSEPEMRQRVLNDTIRQLMGLQERLRDLEELADVYAAIQAAIEKHAA